MIPADLKLFAEDNALKMCAGYACDYRGNPFVALPKINGRLIGYCANEPTFFIEINSKNNLQIVKPYKTTNGRYILLATPYNVMTDNTSYICPTVGLEIIEQINKKELTALIKALEL